MRYKAVVDGKMIWDSNSIRRCKEMADEALDYGTGYHAQIMIGKKVYDFRFYDSNWKIKCRGGK